MTPFLYQVKLHNERWFDSLMFAVHDVEIPKNSPALSTYKELLRWYPHQLIKPEMVMSVNWEDFSDFSVRVGCERIMLGILYSALRDGRLKDIECSSTLKHIVVPNRCDDVSKLEDLL